jgi:DhnA family fructose-bisphosphate aldolase class Ia
MTEAESFKVAVEAAGRTAIICSGGGSLPPRDFLQRLHDQSTSPDAVELQQAAIFIKNLPKKPFV